MDTFFSAILGDLVSRAISFIVDKYNNQWQKDVEEKLLQRHRVMKRIRVTVEMAEVRCITNKAMVQQLQMLREVMYKGCYLIDTFNYQMLQQKRANDKGSHPFTLSTLSPAKRLRISMGRTSMVFHGGGVEEVQKMTENLNRLIEDMAEFIIFLKSYPPIAREPCSKYLFIENCMFGRQAEMEKIISFLLQPEPPGAESLQVLPIIGLPRVGKSTLVEHVCYEEQVLNHFSSIILCSGDPTAPKIRSVKKQTHDFSHGRSLIIMELADDLVLDEKKCRKLYSWRSDILPGSKVILTSRSENIVKFGTTGAIRLKFLYQEAYWYFFKVTAFGSINPDEHQELVSIAMEIAAELNGSFVAANAICTLLRANLNTQFWRKILELERGNAERNILLFGERTQTLLQKNQSAYIWGLSNIPMSFKVLRYETHSPQNELPKAMLLGSQLKSHKDCGELELLVWRSCIPPYHSYTIRCDIEAPEGMMSKKKRPHSMV